MKKYFIGLTILFSIILFTFSSDNVKALTRANITSDFINNYMIIDYNSIASFPNVSSSVLSNFDTKLHQTIDTDNFYYIVYLTHNSDSDLLNVLYFEKNQNVIPYLNFYHNVRNGYHCLDIAWYYPTTINFGTYWYRLSSSNSTYNLSVGYSYSSRTLNFEFGRIFSNNGVDYNQVGLSHSSSSTYLYETNVPIKYISTNHGSDNIDNFYIVNSSDNTNYLILNGDLFLDSNLQMPFLTPPAPELSFTTTNNYDSFNNIISVNIKLNVANYDSNYIYQYQKGGHDDNNWTSLAIEENNGTYYYSWTNWKENTDIYFRVMNPSTHEMVSSATLQITDITSFIELDISNYSSLSGSGYFDYVSSNNYGIVLIPKTTNVEQQSTIYFSVSNVDFTLPSNTLKFGYSMRNQNLSNVSYFDIQTLFSQNPSNTRFDNYATYTDYFSRDNYNIYYFEPLELIYHDDSDYYSSLDKKRVKPLIISFDSNLYEYKIINGNNDINSIVDPNTGDTYILDSIVPDKKINSTGYFTITKNAFNRFKGSLINIMKLITEFYNHLPIILQDFFVFIMFFTILLIVFKFLI